MNLPIEYVRYRRRYDAKRDAGQCARSGCKYPALPGKCLCEMHRARAVVYWATKKARPICST